jgi:DNA helicase-2/ATP-dependent DNA helicase PcrA
VEVENHQLMGVTMGGQKPRIHKYGSDRMEARGIVRDIKLYLTKGIKPGEIAVLSRTSAITYTLERELTAEQIGYIKVGGLKLMNKLNIRQYIAFLELILDRFNWLAWETLFMMIPGIGDDLTALLVQDFRAIPNWGWENPPPVSLGSGKRWKAFQVFWEDMSKVSKLKGLDLQSLLNESFDIFSKIYTRYFNVASEDERQGKVKELFEQDTLEYGSAQADLETRLQEIKDYIVNLTYHRTEFLEQFLDQFKLDDSINQLNTEESKITLSTIHSAKGLEWEVVFVIGLENGNIPPAPRVYGKLRSGIIVPIQTDVENQDKKKIALFIEHPYLEEEKRLFYVACTRAKKYLHITYCSKRRGMGVTDSIFLKSFKPKGAILGAVETDLATFILEKMTTEEEQKYFKKYNQP